MFFLEQVFESPRIPLKWKLVTQMEKQILATPAPRTSGVRLTRRGKRVVRSAVGLSLLVVIGAGFSAVSSAAADSHRVVKSSTVSGNGFTQVTVAPGETLWSLASLVAGGRDIATVVDQIVEANSLSSSDISAGQRLWVPTH